VALIFDRADCVCVCVCVLCTLVLFLFVLTVSLSFRLLALYYAQLICHMTGHTLPQSSDERESVALAVAIVIKHFGVDLVSYLLLHKKQAFCLRHLKERVEVDQTG